MKHYLQETDFSRHEATELFSLARTFKKMRGRHTPPSLAGQTWVLLFDKPSTRTRVSFEVAISELGGHPLYLDARTSQMGRGESLADTARVLSRYAHGLIVRTHSHEAIEELARYATIPVVNALTDLLHPCQSFTDLFTLAEIWSGPDGDMLASFGGRRLVFLGDGGCNVAQSLLLAGHHLGLDVTVASPSGTAVAAAFQQRATDWGLSLEGRFVADPKEAVAGADALYTDTWVSMGHETEAADRQTRFAPYRVDTSLLATAKPEALFLHCLPAHVGEEVTEEVFEGSQSVVFDQAENRLHMQKAILAALAEAERG